MIPATLSTVAYLGAISYSVYLFQDAVIDLALIALGDAPLAFALAVVAGVLVVASAVYELVERPFIALGRRINAGLRAPQAREA